MKKLIIAVAALAAVAGATVVATSASAYPPSNACPAWMCPGK